MAGVLDKAVVVAALDAERLVGGTRGRRALEIRIAADELDRAAELGRLRPQIEGQRLRVDRGLVLRRAGELIAVAVGRLAQHRARHQFVLARHPAARRPRLLVFLGEFIDGVEAPAAALRPFGQLVLEDFHRRVKRMALERHVGRIEQHERVPAPADLDGVLHRGARRHRMEDARGLFRAELRLDLLHHPFEIAGKLRVMVVRGRDRDVPAMIAKIEYQHVEFG